jgi:hypothetical protein
MTHLSESELIDLAEGTLPAPRAQHATACETCRTQADALRRTIEMTSAVPTDMPSPLFWEHFGARVNERIDAQPLPGRWFLLPRFALVGLGTLAVLLLAFNLVIGPRDPRPATPPPSEVASAEDVTPPAEPDDLDQDVEWAIVRAAADELDIDAARAQGLAMKPGSVDRLAMELTEAERAELIRLVQEEMKSGA